VPAPRNAPGSTKACHRRSREAPTEAGFSSIELLLVLAILAVVIVLAGTLTVRLYRRYQMLAAVREVHAMVLATRMHAIKHERNAILLVDLARRRVHSWVDDNGNFAQDAAEPTRTQLQVPTIVAFAMPHNLKVDDRDAVSFDTYRGDKNLTDMIVFMPDGRAVPPQANNSNAPRKPDAYPPDIPYGSIDCRGTNIPSTGLPPLHGAANGNNGMGCRGIYMSKRMFGDASDDVFRISVDDLGRSGKVTLLKWIGPNSRNGLMFVPPSPAWIWFD
jgi:Tfp pilus assembly protein FimT